MLSHAAERSVRGQLLAHFGLRENAFGVTPDPRFLFLSDTHGEALASLVNGIDCDFGFQVLVAQPGMGKTTLLFNFLERFRTTAHTAFLFQPQSNPCELLQSVLLELGIPSEETSLRKLSEQLNQVLTRASRERRRVIVVLDEAQNLDFAVLEALRQLSNFENASTKLMQIVLAGQPQLAKRLALPEQEQLMQRISAFGRLRPLALNETQAYIDHRLATAGYHGANLFTPGAVGSIWDHSRGVPRNINTLCFNAMLLGFAEYAKSIDERIVEETARDLDLNSVLADVYQMDPAGVRPGGSGKVRPIWETNPPETDSARGVIPEAAAVPVGISKDAGATASTAHSGDGNVSDAGQSVRRAPVAVRAQIGPTLEEEGIAPAGKWAPRADTAAAAAPPRPAAQARVTEFDIQAAASEAPANPGKKSPAASTLIQSSPAGAFRGNQTTYPGKNSPPTTFDEPVRPDRVAALAPAPQQKKTVEKKRAESRIWWAQAVALTATIAILAFVLGEEFSAQRPGHVEAHGGGGSAQAQGGYVAPNDGPIDAPDVPPKNTYRVSSNADNNDVTVRKFPTDADAASTSSSKGQRLVTIFFAQDSAMIGSQYGTFLRRIADVLAQNPGASAILEGHTDNTGPESYNLDLSSRRAIAVRNALVDELHVSSTRLAAVGAGATVPVQPNSSAEGRAYNRRVEIRLAHVSD